MESHLLFLGTGGAAGVPLVGCHCEVCRSEDPLNKRLRSSVLLTIGEKKLLIDIGPDFRHQALRYNIHHLDGVLITHAHYDHIGGLDELRVYYILQHQITPLLLSQSTMEDLKYRFPYFFQKKMKGTSLSAQLEFNILEEQRGEVQFSQIHFRYMTYSQGGMKVTGFRFGDLAYISDIREYPDTLFKDLAGIKTLVISALRRTASHVHFSIDEAIEFSRKVGVAKTYFTHMSHELDHELTNNSLPKDFELAHDGLKIGFSNG